MATISLAFHALQGSRIKYKLEFVIVGAADILLVKTVVLATSYVYVSIV